MHKQPLIERQERALLFPQSSTIGVSWFIRVTVRLNIQKIQYNEYFRDKIVNLDSSCASFAAQWPQKCVLVV